jgi:phosphate starvation-inducible PhoH-like protein
MKPKIKSATVETALNNSDIRLNEEQQLACKSIQNVPVTVITGRAGSGKTLLACYAALQLVKQEKVGRIYISRNAVMAEDVGFLPGSLQEKYDPLLEPIHANFELLLGAPLYKQLQELGVIKLKPIAYLNGTTIVDGVFIVDEAQNLSHTQMQMVLSRLGKNSILILCGDDCQIHLKNPKLSGFSFLKLLAKKLDAVQEINLTTNHRHPVVAEILEYYEKALINT